MKSNTVLFAVPYGLKGAERRDLLSAAFVLLDVVMMFLVAILYKNFILKISCTESEGLIENAIFSIAPREVS